MCILCGGVEEEEGGVVRKNREGERDGVMGLGCCTGRGEEKRKRGEGKGEEGGIRKERSSGEGGRSLRYAGNGRGRWRI